MNEFLIALQAKLDEAKSKGNIEGDISKLQSQINALKVKAEIDPASLKNITEQIAKAMSQKVASEGIQINASGAAKSAQAAGQQAGKQFSESMQAAIASNKRAMDNIISDFRSSKLTGLTSKFNLTGKGIDPNVSKEVNKLTKELNSLALQIIKTNGESAWESFIKKSGELATAVKKFGTVKVDMSQYEDIKRVLEYFQGMKINIPENYIKEVLSGLNTPVKNLKELNQQLINLGGGFKSISFAKGQSNLNGDWESIFSGLGRYDLTSETNQIDQYIKLINELLFAKKQLGSYHPVSADDVNKIVIGFMESVEAYSKKANVLRDEEAAIKNIMIESSNSSTSTVLQNEEKKQNAIKKTAKAQREVTDGFSLVKSGSGANVTFNNINTAVEDAKQHFRELLGEENAVISAIQRFDGEGLSSFTVNIKRASGDIESLNYQIRDSQILFNGGQIRQSSQIEQQATAYVNKLNDLKTRLKGAVFDYSEFEKMIQAFRNGEVSINQLSEAFNTLSNNAKSNLKNLNSLKMTPDQITGATKNMNVLRDNIKNLELDANNLKDKTSLAGISFKNLFAAYDSLKAEMDASGGIPLTDKWTTGYQNLMSTVMSLTEQIKTLKKAEASDNSQVTKQANYYSKVLAAMREAVSLKQKSITAGERENAVIKEQLKSAYGKIASNKKQIKVQGLYDKDWEKQLKAEQKRLDAIYARAESRNKDRIMSRQQSMADKAYFKVDTGETSSKVDELIAKTNQWTDANGNARISTANLSSALSELNAAAEAYANNNTADTQNRIISANENLLTEYNKVTNAVRTMNATYAKDTDIASLHNKIGDFIEKNGDIIKHLGTDLNAMFSQTAKGSQITIQELAALEQKFIGVKNAADQIQTANAIYLKVETGESESKVAALIDKTNQWTDANGNARISTANLSSALSELVTASNEYAGNKTESAQKKLIASNEKLDAEYKKVTNSIRQMNAELAKDSAVASLHNKVSEFMGKNGKAVKYYGTQLKDIFNQTAQGSEVSKQKLAQLNQEFIKLQNTARANGKLGKTFFQTLKEGMSSFSYWTSSTFMVMKAIQSIKSGVSTVKELDTALVDLKKTTTMTNSELEEFYYDANETAKEMGVTTQQIIEQASAWSRLGWGKYPKTFYMETYRITDSFYREIS